MLTVKLAKGVLITIITFILLTMGLLFSYLFTGNPLLNTMLQGVLTVANLVAGLFCLFTFFYLKPRTNYNNKFFVGLHTFLVLSGLLNLFLFVLKFL